MRLTVGAFVVVVVLRKFMVSGGGLVIMIGIVLVVAIVLVVEGVVGRSSPNSASLFMWKSFCASTGNTFYFIRFMRKRIINWKRIRAYCLTWLLLHG